MLPATRHGPQDIFYCKELCALGWWTMIIAQRIYWILFSLNQSHKIFNHHEGLSCQHGYIRSLFCLLVWGKKIATRSHILLPSFKHMCGWGQPRTFDSPAFPPCTVIEVYIIKPSSHGAGLYACLARSQQAELTGLSSFVLICIF